MITRIEINEQETIVHDENGQHPIGVMEIVLATDELYRIMLCKPNKDRYERLAVSIWFYKRAMSLERVDHTVDVFSLDVNDIVTVHMMHDLERSKRRKLW